MYFVTHLIFCRYDWNTYFSQWILCSINMFAITIFIEAMQMKISWITWEQTTLKHNIYIYTMLSRHLSSNPYSYPNTSCPASKRCFRKLRLSNYLKRDKTNEASFCGLIVKLKAPGDIWHAVNLGCESRNTDRNIWKFLWFDWGDSLWPLKIWQSKMQDGYKMKELRFDLKNKS